MAVAMIKSKVISRSDGRSAVASAAYRSAERIKDDTGDKTYNYEAKTAPIHKEVVVPVGSPDWCRDRAKLWNEAERRETRMNSRTAREYIVALPAEFTLEENKELLRGWVKANFVGRGLVADICIHPPSKTGDERNIHAHILVTTRQVVDGKLGPKDRQLDSPKNLVELKRSWSLHYHQANMMKAMAEGKPMPKETIIFKPTGKNELAGVHESLIAKTRREAAYYWERARIAGEDLKKYENYIKQMDEEQKKNQARKMRF